MSSPFSLKICRALRVKCRVSSHCSSNSRSPSGHAAAGSPNSLTARSLTRYAARSSSSSRARSSLGVGGTSLEGFGESVHGCWPCLGWLKGLPDASRDAFQSRNTLADRTKARPISEESGAWVSSPSTVRPRCRVSSSLKVTRSNIPGGSRTRSATIRTESSAFSSKPASRIANRRRVIMSRTSHVSAMHSHKPAEGIMKGYFLRRNPAAALGLGRVVSTRASCCLRVSSASSAVASSIVSDRSC